MTSRKNTSITFGVVSRLYPGVTTVGLDNLATKTATTMQAKHAGCGILAARIAVSILHKKTKRALCDVMENLHNVRDIFSNEHKPTISVFYNDIIQKHNKHTNTNNLYV